MSLGRIMPMRPAKAMGTGGKSRRTIPFLRRNESGALEFASSGELQAPREGL
jgi:hypothetical protein